MKDLILPPELASYLCLVCTARAPNPKTAALHALTLALLAPYEPTQDAPCKELDITKVLPDDWMSTLQDAIKEP